MLNYESTWLNSRRRNWVHLALASPWWEERNWVFATNSDFLFPISLQPNLFQTMNSVGLNNLRLKYRWFPPLGCIDIGIKKIECAAKTQFLWILCSTLWFDDFYMNLDTHGLTRARCCSIRLFEFIIVFISIIEQSLNLRSFLSIITPSIEELYEQSNVSNF